MTHLILIGPPGSWCEEVGEYLSETHQIPYASTDQAVQHVTGVSLDALAIDHSHREFREWEEECAYSLLVDLANTQDDRILVLGSGCAGESVTDESGMRVREQVHRAVGTGAVVVELTADFSTLVHRTHLDGPRIAAVSSPRKIFYRQLADRHALYSSLASAEVDTTNLSIPEVAARVFALCWDGQVS